MIRLMSSRRRLLRKNMYRAPHTRHERNILSGTHPKKHNKPRNDPHIKFKKKPVRRVNNGYKMSYRYKYYNQVNVEDDIEESE